jgi:hypothetical protein
MSFNLVTSDFLGNSNQFGHGYEVLHSFSTIAPNVVKTQPIDKNILDFVLDLSLLTAKDYDWWTQLNLIPNLTLILGNKIFRVHQLVHPLVQ